MDKTKEFLFFRRCIMKKTFGFTVKDIAEIAILSARAIVLDRVVRIPLGATGGSINISMVPLYVIALRHGWFKSFIAGGIVYGLITCSSLTLIESFLTSIETTTSGFNEGFLNLS